MTISERIQLHRLGYTKEEINDLATAGYDPAGLTDPPQEPTEPEQDPAPDPTEPEQDPAPAPDPEQTPAYIAGIQKSLDALTKALQAANMQKAEQPVKRETVDDVFNSIIK